MVTSLDSVAPGLSAERGAALLCVHFAADGREHSMWYFDPGDGARRGAAGFAAGLDAEWSRSPAGVPRAVVLRRAGDVLCEALLLRPADGGADPSSNGTSWSAGTSGFTGILSSTGIFGGFGSDARRRDNALLRAEGVPAYPASMIAEIRHRPMLVTFARRVDLPAALARHVHGLLVRGAPPEVRRCPVCAGAGYVRGEPCLACS